MSTHLVYHVVPSGSICFTLNNLNITCSRTLKRNKGLTFCDDVVYVLFCISSGHKSNHTAVSSDEYNNLLPNFDDSRNLLGEICCIYHLLRGQCCTFMNQ
jgi:hypothetical protein